MKTLQVQQIFNQEFRGDRTPDIDSHVWKVTKVTNSTEPRVFAHLTVDELTVYCDSDEWQVTIT